LSNPKGLKERIDEILKAYLQVESYTNTKDEEKVDAFFNETVGGIKYFKEHEDLYGQYETKDPDFNRHVNYALYLGSKETYVLLHHSDVVNIDNYSRFKALALKPEELAQAYIKDKSLLSEEAFRDLESGDYLFGRGTADMKAGGAIELALLDYYSELDDSPSILVLAVPDEENQSLGMRAAIRLLEDLKDKYDLDYKLMINTEPHQRLNDERGVISQGSIGKMNVFVHVKGVLAHAGKALEGINPNGILANIVRHLDLNESFVDHIGHEMSIPPTWVMMRDNKKVYDISFPSMAYGILNVTSFTDSPQVVIDKLKTICQNASNEYIDHVNERRIKFSEVTSRGWGPFKKKKCVKTLAEFLNETELKLENYPEDIEEALINTNDDEPMIVIGIIPPYYPAITNDNQDVLMDLINDFTIKSYNQHYDNRMYFTGISDLSYSKCPSKSISSEMNNILGWGDKYSIPFEVLKRVEMPCINIGPWGKDFHKPSERVYKEDLYYRTPEIIKHVIKNYKGESNV